MNHTHTPVGTPTAGALSHRCVGALLQCVVLLCACGGGGSGGQGGAGSNGAAVVSTAGAATVCTVPGASQTGVFGATVSPGANETLIFIAQADGYHVGFYGHESGSAFVPAGEFRLRDTCQPAGRPAHNAAMSGLGEVLVSARFDPNIPSITGSIQANTVTLAYAGGPIPGSAYDYRVPAKVADAVGDWVGLPDLAGRSDGLAIHADGSATGRYAGCRIAGEVAPEPGGKSLLVLRMSLDPATCAPGAGTTLRTFEGFILVYTVAGGDRLFTYALGTDEVGWDWADWFLTASRP